MSPGLGAKMADVTTALWAMEHREQMVRSEVRACRAKNRCLCVFTPCRHSTGQIILAFKRDHHGSWVNTF